MSAKSSSKDTRDYFNQKYSRNMPAFLKRLADEHAAPIHDDDELEGIKEK